MKIGYFKKYPTHCFGIEYKTDFVVGRVKKRKILVFFFHKWYHAVSNMPLI